jgi:hypothetical protein
VPEELLPFQGFDGCVNDVDVDDGDLTSLGQRLEPLKVWSADATSCSLCRHENSVDEM